MWRIFTLAALALALVAASPAGRAVAKEACPAAGFTLIEPQASAATRSVRGPKNQRLHVRREMLTTTADLAEVKADGDKVDGILTLKFKPEAEARLIAVTTRNSGVRIAFVVDDEALLAVTWEGDYGMDPGGSQLSVERGYVRVRRLAEALQGCIGAPSP